jgi:hypothetical protein
MRAMTVAAKKEAPVTWTGARGFEFYLQWAGPCSIRPHSDYARPIGRSSVGASIRPAGADLESKQSESQISYDARANEPGSNKG